MLALAHLEKAHTSKDGLPAAWAFSGYWRKPIFEEAKSGKSRKCLEKAICKEKIFPQFCGATKGESTVFDTDTDCGTGVPFYFSKDQFASVWEYPAPGLV